MKILCVVLALLVAGCATTKITVIKPDGTYINGEATAFMGADQKGIDLAKDGDDWLFEMEQQKSEADIFLQGLEIGKTLSP